MLMFSFAVISRAQTTYYWAGGTTASSLTGSDWSTTPGGAASTSRSASDDILVFDNTTVAFDISSATIGKLVIQNNADVTFTRSAASSGTTTLTLAGVSGVGLNVNNGKLRILGSTSGYNFTLQLPSTITGSVTNGGQVFITGTANNRISTLSAGALVFASGTICTVNSGVSPFDISTNVAEGSVVFNSGSTLNYYGGISPFGNTTSANIISLSSGSTTNFYAAPTSSGTFSNRIFGNVVIKTGTTINLNSPAENFIKINDLTIENGATFNLRVSGGNAITGNILNNGTLGIGGTPGSSQIVMAGTLPQSVSGSGTFNALACFSVANDANVTLGKSLVLNGTSTSNIIGILNFGTNTISGTNNFQFRPSVTLSDANGSLTTGSNIVSMGNSTDYNALSPTVGLLVTGNGIPANSYIIGTSSGSFSFTISNFATATATGVSITTTGGAPTFATSNPSGPDASLTTSGSTKNLGSGTNLIINAATSAPFPTFSTNNIGRLTISAAATTNRNATVDGEVALNNAKLTIREGDIFTISSTAVISGYSANAYMVTSANTGTGAISTVSLPGVSSSKFVPVGSASNYLPLILNPSSISDFTVNVFQGATADATPNGTALTSGQKADLVDAIYNISRTSGTGNVDVTLGWPSALEGSNFSSLSDAQVGVAQFSGSSYSTFVGPGNNTSNTISTTVSSFAPFLIGKVGTLPVKLISFIAKAVNQTAVLNWQSTSEVNLSNFLVQRSVDGQSFSDLGNVAANNVAGVFNYSFTDKSPNFGANYYRLVSVDLDGSQCFSNIQAVSFGSLAISVNTYPNPTTNQINMAGLRYGDSIKLFDFTGKLVKMDSYIDSGIKTLNISELNSGIYVLIVENEGKINYSNRIIKN